MGENKGWAVYFGYYVSHSERFTRAGYAEQYLSAFAFYDAINELFDGLRLIASGGIG